MGLEEECSCCMLVGLGAGLEGRARCGDGSNLSPGPQHSHPSMPSGTVYRVSAPSVVLWIGFSGICDKTSSCLPDCLLPLSPTLAHSSSRVSPVEFCPHAAPHPGPRSSAWAKCILPLSARGQLAGSTTLGLGCHSGFMFHSSSWALRLILIMDSEVVFTGW